MICSSSFNTVHIQTHTPLIPSPNTTTIHHPPPPTPPTEEKAGNLDLARKFFRKALECKSRSIPTLVALAQLEGPSFPLAFFSPPRT
jgi:hypothetical protein